MKETIIEKSKNDKFKTYLTEFNSINEFYEYICNTPLNEAFRCESYLSSRDNEEMFSGTKSFEEATELLKHGCEDIAKKLNNKLNASKNDIATVKRTKTFYDVQGYQACVPLYLQGVPTNMINKKQVVVKHKVITLTKAITYNAFVSKETILEESVKALQLVKKIEAQGTRCNLNIIFSSEKNCIRIATKIRIKNATEKLNVSKLAFCMVHPSMLRRLLFGYIEVYPNTTKQFTYGYGRATGNNNLKKLMGDNEYFIPPFITNDINNINDLSNIK